MIAHHAELPPKAEIHIALLEDDELLADVIAQALGQEQYKCRQFSTVADICSALLVQPFNLLILDWSLPDGESDKVIRLVRKKLNLSIPIIIESANDDEQHVVNALLLGADDYVRKPLRIPELLARVTVLLRKSEHKISSVTELGGYRFDEKNKLLYNKGVPLNLTSLEYELALYLFIHLNELLTRERLLKDVWGLNADIDTRTVDVFISRLRKKLSIGTDDGVHIQTLRGYGFRLELASKDGQAS